MQLSFKARAELAEYEWNAENPQWHRLKLAGGNLNELSKASNLRTFLRVGLLYAIIIAMGTAAVMVSRKNIWLSIPLFYLYFFFFGFQLSILHEGNHKTLFGRSLTWLNEALHLFVSVMLWDNPYYQRLTHRTHHRYTMVRGGDLESPWPDVVTTKWLRGFFRKNLLQVLFIGHVIEGFPFVRNQFKRAMGIISDPQIRAQCSLEDIAVIRRQAIAGLLFHAVVIVLSIIFRRWEPIVLVTIAGMTGMPIALLWFYTEHIGMPYNVNDFRLCTRSLKVNWLIKQIYFGLDDHIEHHLFPGVPSCNLPKVHALLKDELPEPGTMVQCWREMFAIARKKDTQPDQEYVPIAV